MANEIENMVSALNGLISINNDRLEGFRKAAADTQDSGLTSLLDRMGKESKDFNDKLGGLVSKYGETPNAGQTLDGRVHQGWLDSKAKLFGRDRDAILSSCEFGETAAVEAYDAALQLDKIQALPEVNALLTNQRQTIFDSLQVIKSMRGDQDTDAENRTIEKYS